RQRSKGPKRGREPHPRPSRTLSDHFEEVRGQQLARFLSRDFTVLKESPAKEVEHVLDELDGQIAGLVLDGEVNQRLLDQLVGKGLEYVAAREFRGIIKRPLSIRLLKI
ncbi:MAG: DNA primase, partial [Methanoregulaceae archaeon]|nr:DNA primase [Methanoregulaceae archaeon]